MLELGYRWSGRVGGYVRTGACGNVPWEWRVLRLRCGPDRGARKTKRPRLSLRLGTYVDQPSPKCCSRRSIDAAAQPGNGPIVPCLVHHLGGRVFSSVLYDSDAPTPVLPDG